MTRLIIEIAPYRVGWPAIFRDIAGRLRDTLGERIIALHHIGSTAVPSLAAKDIIDIQLTVASLGAHPDPSIEAAGFQLGRPTSDHCPPGLTLQPAIVGLSLNGDASQPPAARASLFSPSR